MDFNAGSPVGRRWAEPLAASGHLHGRHWAGSHGRRQLAKTIFRAVQPPLLAGPDAEDRFDRFLRILPSPALASRHWLSRSGVASMFR